MHERDVGFVDFDLRFDHRHVGHRQQHGTGIVHRADDDVLADFDVASSDDAIERRLEPRLRQRMTGAGQTRLLLTQLLLTRLDFLFTRAQFGLSHVQL